MAATCTWIARLPEMNAPVPITERRYVAPFILVTTLFFLWALGVNLNDVLIPHLKKVFDLNDLQSALIQTAFFGGYFLAAVPAGRLMETIGYRRGIVTGLITCAAGALLFLPAALIQVYGLFLLASFVMACGQGVLEVAANPYVTLLGPPESSERRLNLAQSFNSVGAVVTPFIGAAFILSTLEYSREQLAAMTPEQVAAYRTAVVGTVRIPYLVIAGIFLAVAVMIYFSHLPEPGADPKQTEEESTGEELRDLWRYGHLIKGVMAQFFYVGAQVGVGSFVIRLAQHSVSGMIQKDASFYLKLHLIGFMVGRFSGSYVMKRVPAAKLLALFASSTLICLGVVLFGSGVAPLWAVVLIGFFHSIMFPTIFALSIKHLGRYTKLGSSLLVASIIGGAVCPAIMGFISDHSNIRVAFIVPLICQIYVLYFAVRGYKPVLVRENQSVQLSPVQ
jgi:MFS transporter, FHS family, L-fucose permease